MRTAYQYYKGEVRESMLKKREKSPKLDFDTVNQKFSKRKVLLSTMGGRERPTSNLSSTNTQNTGVPTE